jgi:5-methyltetrahydrofolate--homocysteine methyltransferase
MLISARAMQTALGILKPKLAEIGVEPMGKVVIGTVKGDLHDIGKNLVAMMLEGAGFEIKIIIGGAPVTSEYAQKIGADGYATDASQAVTLAKSLMA